MDKRKKVIDLMGAIDPTMKRVDPLSKYNLTEDILKNNGFNDEDIDAMRESADGDINDNITVTTHEELDNLFKMIDNGEL